MTQIMQGMVIGSEDLFQLALAGRARKYVIINIILLGVLFGLSNLVGELRHTPELPLEGGYALITPAIFSVAGIITMSCALIGFTLIYWAATRAFGGQGGIGIILDLIGLALMPFWILAPLMNYTLRYAGGQNRVLLFLFVGLSFFWSFRIVQKSIMTGQGLSATKAALALAGMWIFSISAVYVFLP